MQDNSLQVIYPVKSVWESFPQLHARQLTAGELGDVCPCANDKLRVIIIVVVS